MLVALLSILVLSCKDDDPTLSKLSFKNATESMQLGATQSIAFDWAPDEVAKPAVNWTSSDIDVATVSDKGEITTVGLGKTTIKVTAVENSAMTAQFELTVNPIPVTAISLGEESMEVLFGKTVTITPTVEPENATDKTLNWTSSNEKIAVVDDGEITAVAEGETTITAEKDGVTTTIKIIVKMINVASVDFELPPVAISVGQTHQLAFTILPEDASINTLTWTSADEAILTVDENGVVTAKAIGAAEVTATAHNGVKITRLVSTKPIAPPPPPPPPPPAN